MQYKEEQFHKKCQNGDVYHYEFGKLAGWPFQKTNCLCRFDLTLKFYFNSLTTDLEDDHF